MIVTVKCRKGGVSELKLGMHFLYQVIYESDPYELSCVVRSSSER